MRMQTSLPFVDTRFLALLPEILVFQVLLLNHLTQTQKDQNLGQVSTLLHAYGSLQALFFLFHFERKFSSDEFVMFVK